MQATGPQSAACRILLFGASGYIGRHLLADLRARGCEVRIAVHRHAAILHQFPELPHLKWDWNRPVDHAQWEQLDAFLTETDVIINATGIMQSSWDNAIDRVHCAGPLGVLQRAQAHGVRRYIHFSALGIQEEQHTAYARTKRDFEQRCAEQAGSVDWVIFQPSLIYGAVPSSGMALLRGLAALPLILPVIGRGEQWVQPVYIRDVLQAVWAAVAHTGSLQRTIALVGPDVIPLRTVLADCRAWMGLAPARRIVHLPEWAMRVLARIGDYLPLGLNSTAYAMLQQANTADVEPISELLGRLPTRWKVGWQQEPGDPLWRWHALRALCIHPVLQAVQSTWRRTFYRSSGRRAD